eukprot:5788963-Prymnesium_polylepis.1
MLELAVGRVGAAVEFGDGSLCGRSVVDRRPSCHRCVCARCIREGARHRRAMRLLRCAVQSAVGRPRRARHFCS